MKYDHFKWCPQSKDEDGECRCLEISKADKDEVDEERGVEELRASKERREAGGRP